MRGTVTLGEAVEQKSAHSLSMAIPSWARGERGVGGSLLSGTLIHFSGCKLGDTVNLEKE